MARRSTLRAADSDRERVVERLRRAAGEGRLLAEELEERIGQVFSARTYGELDRLVSDLPSEHPAQRRRSTGRRALATVRAHPALLVVAIPVALFLVATILTIAMVWAAITLLLLVLGHRRRWGRCGPWTYAGRGRRLYISRF